VSFDLDNDFVTPTYHRGLLDGTFLTVVHGMLGLVSRDTLSVMNNIEVWVKWKPHFLYRLTLQGRGRTLFKTVGTYSHGGRRAAMEVFTDTS
jgi:hypothetical protein